MKCFLSFQFGGDLVVIGLRSQALGRGKLTFENGRACVPPVSASPEKSLSYYSTLRWLQKYIYPTLLCYLAGRLAGLGGRSGVGIWQRESRETGKARPKV